MHSSGVAKPTEFVNARLGAVFYNVGLNAGQVQTQQNYNSWVLTYVRRV